MNLPDETLRRLSGKPELARDARIREIARDVLDLELEDRYRLVSARFGAWEIQTALNAAFAAGMEFQRKHVQDAD